MNKKKDIIFEKEYHGFEDSSDLERDVSEALQELPSEFSDSIKVTIQYIKEL